ncbi:PROTEIN FAR1-RELATED SEQUENCE 10-RELATED [Salix viminalis]|uniref:Protein FAR1-RELATED SEQUENCE n=1 Tax=Salix viminalis TaxID=40686 RepID=A0A9Q0SEJ8_SALVM|nr:PROTEIN FAR1-RELATED SEQUENCE 10-RELATED [Salix viminalis]
MKPSNNIWIQRQQCPCGDWKCYIKYEGDDQTSASSQTVKSETTSSELVFTPYVGQIFKSDDDAFEYYSNFARKNGFSIRKARSTESQHLGIYRRDFVCYRSGFNQPRKKANVEHPRDRKSIRCGCDAKLYLTKEIVDGLAQWYVSQFSNVHNHELLEDDQVRLLPAYRKIQEADQERILLLSKAGFPINRIVKVLELEKGVRPGQLPFIEKDVRNFVRTCKKTVQENDALLTEKRENDTLELLEACKSVAERDPDFAYDYTTDENDKVENIAWSYGDSVRAYALYGDVVTFDTTYRSITYGLLLGVWFGMDNHGRAILYGCVLLQDESSHSFTWALQTFVRFIRGRHPQTIVTDMELALRDAIARELPNTKHVVCIWHILSKLSSWLSFPLGSRFELVSDKHMALLFSYRGFWSISYIRGSFLARTMTPEFSQSLHAFLKRILSGQTCLQVFFEQVGLAAPAGNQTRDGMRYMHIKTCLPIEEHARSVLTPYAFNVLQHEIVLSLQYAIQEMADGSYLARHFKKMDGECLVIWMPEDEQIHCSCKEFEHSGILCRHSLRLLEVKNYFQLPERYFLPRWRRDQSLFPMDDQNSQSNNDDCAQALHALTETLLTESLTSKERFNHVQREITGLLAEVRSMPVAEELSLNMPGNNVSET